MSSENAMVSVVIPTYNRAPYVTMAIESALAQSYQDYEIIVVDDGSTDGTRDVLEPYRDRIRYMYQDNKGVSAARNTGIQESRGEWIAFLDSDDEWLPNKLEIQMGYIKSYPEICLLIANMTVIKPHGDTVSLFNAKGFDKIADEFLYIERPLIQLLRYNFAYPSAALVKKSTLTNAGMFDQYLSLHEDTDIFYRMALEGKWGVLGQSLARKYRRTEPLMINLSARHSDEPSYSYKVMVKILERLQCIEKLTEYEHRMVKKHLSIYMFLVGVKLRAEGKKGYRSWFSKGLRANPSLKIFLKWLIFNVPFGVDFIASRLRRFQ